MSRLRSAVWSGMMVVGASASLLPAQQSAAPAGVQDRQVRVHHDCFDSVCHRVVGRLVAVTSDSVMVDAGTGVVTAIARATVDRVEVRHGWGGLAKGGLMGLSLGAATGLAAGAIYSGSSSLNCEYDLGESCATFVAQTGLVGAGVGLVLGAVIGGATGGSGWKRVSLDTLEGTGPAVAPVR